MRAIAVAWLAGILAMPAQAAGAADAPAPAARGVLPVGPAGTQKQWKLVFRDEFEGKTLDPSKWTRGDHGEAFIWNGAKGRPGDDHADVDGLGHFVVKVTRDADGTYLYHGGVRTKGKFQRTYGYFETRVKFSRQPGWWGAVWLYGVEVGPNPFLMGQEIDIFEDFVKPKTKSDFAHNVHFDSGLDFAPGDERKRQGKLDGGELYRVSRGTKVEVDDWDAFHVVAVEWTPLEYVFYCDGRETWRLDYTQVPVTNQPMHVLISGCFRPPRRGSFIGDYADATWPDRMVVDYVRAWEEDLGDRKRPSVALRLITPTEGGLHRQDLAFELTVEAAGRPVKDVLLFDNGRLRGQAPAGLAASGQAAGNPIRLTVPGDQLFGGQNIFIVMARDAGGVIGVSEPLTVLVLERTDRPRTPYQGKAQAIPGRIVAGHYDEGGQGVAYGSYLKHNLFGRPPWNLKFRPDEGISSPNQTGIGASHRGLWVMYSVDVQAAGDYRATAFIARPDAMRGWSQRPDRIALELDGRPLAEFTFRPEFTTGRNYWADYKPVGTQNVRLPAGRHTLRVQFDATPFNFGGLEFTPATAQTGVP